jgi:biotin carboxyl carrier protein
MLNIMRSEFTDRQAADNAARAAMLQQAGLQIQEHEAYLQDDEARLNAETLRAQAEQASQAAWQAALDAQSQMDLRAAQARRADAAAAIDQATAQRRAAGPAAPHAPASPFPGTVLLPEVAAGHFPDAAAFHPSVSEASAIHETVGASRRIASAADTLQQLHEQYGTEIIDQDAVARASVAARAIQDSMSVISHMGVVSGPEREQLEAFVANPLEVSHTVDGLPRVRAILDRVLTSADEELYSYGLALAPTGRERTEEAAAASFGLEASEP